MLRGHFGQRRWRTSKFDTHHRHASDRQAEAEQSAVPILNATRDPIEATLGTALDKCHNAGINVGLETWRQFTEWEPKLTSLHVRLLLQMFSFQLDGDMSAKLSSLNVQCATVKEHLIRNIARLDNPRPRAKGRTKARPKRRHLHLKPIRDNHPRQRPRVLLHFTYFDLIYFHCIQSKTKQR